MTLRLIIKAVMVWLIMMVVAIANGYVREELLVPGFGQAIALPASGATLAIFVFVIVYFSIPFLGRHSGKTYILLGLQWLLMTLLFEFVFGHYIAGLPWGVLLQAFNVFDGNLFVLVLLVTLLSPWIAAKLHGFLNHSH